MPTPDGSDPTTTADVLVVGGGPAGATCAGFCARAGLRVVVVERAIFPRDKVCGDCLNPDCWPVFERLGVEDAVRALPHAALRAVEFVGLRGQPIRLPLPDAARGEIAVKRRDLDALLLDHAAALGADVRQGWALHSAMGAVREGFHPDAAVIVADATNTTFEEEKIGSRFFVAADGRNSLMSLFGGQVPYRPGAKRDPNARIGLQTHIPCPPDFGPRVQMRWFADGYGGLCPVGGGELNISLAAPPRAIERLRRWAQGEFSLAHNHPWRTIAPLDRLAATRAASRAGNIYLVGDAARVVEPFTGEGIYYALRSGELAAAAIIDAARGTRDPVRAAEDYCRAHAAMYRGRLWVNRLARAAGRHPRAASRALEVLRWQPGLLRYLTAKVVR